MAFPAKTRRTAARAASAVLLAGAAIIVPACDADDPRGAAEIRVRDGAERIVALDRPAGRVVSLMPSVTEWVIALGAADRLVARTDYDDHPATAELPSVGGGLDPSVEWLATRRPDLVIAWPDAPSRSLVGQLEALGIAVYQAPTETIAEALDVARDLGVLLGREDAAAAAIAEVGAGLDSVRRAVAGRPRPDVLYLIGLDPPMAAGPGTFVDELLGIAGGRNVLEGAGQRWPRVSVEEVVARDPDVIIVAAASGEDAVAGLAGRPGWRGLEAVREGRVHAVSPDQVNRPGPTLAASAALLARLLHPRAP